MASGLDSTVRSRLMFSIDSDRCTMASSVTASPNGKWGHFWTPEVTQNLNKTYDQIKADSKQLIFNY